MPDKNIIFVNIQTRWNSIYDMIKATLEKKRSVEGNGKKQTF